MKLVPARRSGDLGLGCQNFIHRSNVELQDFLDDRPDAGALFEQLGSDGVILTFWP